MTETTPCSYLTRLSVYIRPPLLDLQLTLIWILFLPFAIAKHATSLLECNILVFIVTYGFMGLTQAEIEMHDPLGNDQNDIETERYTQIVVMDIENYLGSDERVQRLLEGAFRPSPDTTTTVASTSYGSIGVAGGVHNMMSGEVENGSNGYRA